MKATRLACCAALLLPGFSHLARADGIPEPSMILYGVITDPSGGGTRVSYGSLSWTFRPADGSAPIVLTAPVTNINDQFCYVLRVPCETQIGTTPVSAGALKLSSSPTSYDRSQVIINGMAAVFVQPSQTNLTLLSTDRGRIEEVDLLVNLNSGSLIPCAWQIQYFGYCGIDPFDDPDHDGMNNYQEYLAGTNPLDAQSRFQIVRVRRDPSGPFVDWSSVAGKLYTVQRSSSLLSGFADLQTHIGATAPLNSYHDTNAPAGSPYFYRIRVE